VVGLGEVGVRVRVGVGWVGRIEGVCEWVLD